MNLTSLKRIVGATLLLPMGLGLSLAGSLSAPAQSDIGAPNGAHFNLNLIGVPKDKSADMTGSNGHRIFVPLTGNCRINLSMGDYQVLDGNCTDGPAAFQLPDPDSDGDGVTAYSVYARALGKPGSSAVATTCYTDAAGAEWCSTENVVLVRSTGPSKFANVSKELLSVCLDTDADRDCDIRSFLFDDDTSGVPPF